MIHLLEIVNQNNVFTYFHRYAQRPHEVKNILSHHLYKLNSVRSGPQHSFYSSTFFHRLQSNANEQVTVLVALCLKINLLHWHCIGIPIEFLR